MIKCECLYIDELIKDMQQNPIKKVADLKSGKWLDACINLNEDYEYYESGGFIYYTTGIIADIREEFRLEDGKTLIVIKLVPELDNKKYNSNAHGIYIKIPKEDVQNMTTNIMDLKTGRTITVALRPNYRYNGLKELECFCYDLRLGEGGMKDGSVKIISLEEYLHYSENKTKELIEKNKKCEIEEKEIQKENRKAYNENLKKENSQKEGCYIATAVYGSYEAPEVLILRRFRDNVLMKYKVGRIFIEVYYTYSPKAARRLKESIRINHFVKMILDRWVCYLDKK